MIRRQSLLLTPEKWRKQGKNRENVGRNPVGEHRGWGVSRLARDLVGTRSMYARAGAKRYTVRSARSVSEAARGDKTNA